MILRIFLSFFILLSLVIGIVAFAKTPRYTNKLRREARMQELAKEIEKIPIYRERLEGDYTILGPVIGQDMLTKKRKAIIWQMRVKAYKMQADAIMEYHCKPIAKALFVSCEGFAIRYK
jgi:hypothetical protein